MQLLFKKPLLYILQFFFLSLLVRGLYTLCASYLPYESHIDVALANSIIALFAIPFLSRGNSQKILKSLVPGLLIILLASLLSAVSGSFNPHSKPFLLDINSILITCLWIPIVEELVYRKFFSFILVDKDHVLWSCYLSGLFFALNHHLLNITELPINIISLPVGPFLLGVICQYLVLYSGSIIGAVFFHFACNMTVYIFMYNDNRWLNWLSYLYLSGN